MKNIFISYSHKDQELRRKLEDHFAPQKANGAIEIWHDQLIRAGDNFNDKILSKLRAADVILLLVSPDFLASDYCTRIEKAEAL